MILDQYKRIETYAGLGIHFETAVRFIRSFDFTLRTERNFDIDGTRVYAFARFFDLNDYGALRYETHRRYADIQMVIDGCETIYAIPAVRLCTQTAYDSQRDIQFYRDPAERTGQTRLQLASGDFGIFFPWDAHKPCCGQVGSGRSFKLVVKVLLV